ncbi:hypothetical protein BASA50_007661 [Batrachochytrium salamandrivorans]|uniref:Uncharacterized protein n=1 Tax=Batrachochytrium salamandrivorans TaxID=1357716 RepID=A0ABQ8F6E9_9FUNG|nr:hypothetical protein BASA60_001487 [Batrachochytrium salamandrivorans]KAH6593028.1 hypothetical protein BASA50_007661 [Batrachochytrium salamandrivorans]KAH9245310.1 hypothetical protein BASA81_017219 [Batrachochytrium salamandrivorans]
MKLISFAVVSLLVITVSAQILTKPPASNYVLQPNQDSIDEEIQELTTAYQLQREVVNTIGGLEELEQEEMRYKLVMKDFESRLERSYVTGVDKSEIKKKYGIANNEWRKASDLVLAKGKELREATAKRDGIEVKLLTLKDNHELRIEHNNRNQNQIGLSPGSYYSKRILVKQTNEICRNADDLSAANGIIEDGIVKLSGMIRKRNDPMKFEFRDLWGELMSSRNKLVREVKFTERYCAYTRELQVGIDWDPVSSPTGGMFQSILQKFGMN